MSGFVYIDDLELKNIVLMCFEKLFLGFNIYEG